MINVRNKGASFERDIAKKLNALLSEHNIDYVCKRNLEQYQERDKGDLTIPLHVIECKRYKEGSWYKDAWWSQVEKSAEDQIPVLIYKFDRQPIRVVVPITYINNKYKNSDIKCVMSFDQWLELLVTVLKEHAIIS